MSKAQAVVTDLFIAFFLFIAILSATIYTWNLYITRLNENRENSEMLIKAFQATEGLIKTEGIPGNWNLNNVNLSGLGANRILSTEKINLFMNLPEDKIKNIFRIQLYNFNFTLKDKNGNILKNRGSLTGQKFINVKRYVLYQNAPAILEFKIGK